VEDDGETAAEAVITDKQLLWWRGDDGAAATDNKKTVN
jgi:hypothetical protein